MGEAGYSLTQARVKGTTVAGDGNDVVEQERRNYLIVGSYRLM